MTFRVVTWQALGRGRRELLDYTDFPRMREATRAATNRRREIAEHQLYGQYVETLDVPTETIG